jgi:hypothetical protein
MRKMYTLIVITLLISSCKNIQKMVDRGEYDKAIFYAAEKLHGKKNKKTKHVKALEEAFYKVNARDLDRIAFLEAKSTPDYHAIYDTYGKIKNRQGKIAPFLPLISKDGYYGVFDFLDVNDKMAAAASKAMAEDYARGIASLERAKAGDKLAARRAYDHFDRTRRYERFYMDTELLMTEAHDIGKTRILLESVNDAQVYMPVEFERHVMSINFAELNSFWVEYFNGHVDGLEMDVKATLTLNDLDVGPESEYVDRHRDTKRIKDGFVWVEHIETSVDTAGNEIKKKVRVKKDKFKKVHADVIQTKRNKDARALATLSYIDYTNGNVLATEPIRVNASFQDEGLHYHGDHRALCGNHAHHINSIDVFPSDYEMSMVAAENMKAYVRGHLRDFVY